MVFFQAYPPKEFSCFIKIKLSHFLSTLINDCQFESSVYSFVHLVFIDFCEIIICHRYVFTYLKGSMKIIETLEFKVLR